MTVQTDSFPCLEDEFPPLRSVGENIYDVGNDAADSFDGVHIEADCIMGNSMPQELEEGTERGCRAWISALPSTLKMPYEAAKKRAEPYTKIVGELPEMRRKTVQLVHQAVRNEGRRAYVLVNNRLEGSAPLTVQALTEMLSKYRPGPA
jgi:hypothetical protein